MSEYVRGIVYIINISPDNPKDNEDLRRGSEKDVKRIEKTFKTLKADVVTWKKKDDERQFEEIEDFIREVVKKQSFANYEYVVIFFGCHGNWDDLAQLTREKKCTNEKEGESKKNERKKKKEYEKILSNIQKLLLKPLYEIEELNGKLKWLITQTCRGPRECKELDTDAKHFTNYFLRSYSTIEGNVSYRSSTAGSVFITTLCEELDRSAKDTNLLEIYDAVTEKLKEITKKVVKTTQDTFQIADSDNNFGCRDFSFRCGFVEKQVEEQVNECT